MTRKPVFLLAMLSIFIISTIAYLHFRIPPGVTRQSNNAEIIAWVSLAASIASLIGSVIGLANTVVKLTRRNDRE
jgi:hypothetical protein